MGKRIAAFDSGIAADRCNGISTGALTLSRTSINFRNHLWTLGTMSNQEPGETRFLSRLQGWWYHQLGDVLLFGACHDVNRRIEFVLDAFEDLERR